MANYFPEFLDMKHKYAEVETQREEYGPDRGLQAFHEAVFGAAQNASEASVGLRYDDGKLRYELIPPEWDEALAEVLTKGAAKYAPRNWEKGMAWSKLIGSGMRHLAKFLTGERYDKETGCHHLAHMAWNALALMSYDLREIGENDLPKYQMKHSVSQHPAG